MTTSLPHIIDGVEKSDLSPSRQSLVTSTAVDKTNVSTWSFRRVELDNPKTIHHYHYGKPAFTRWLPYYKTRWRIFRPLHYRFRLLPYVTFGEIIFLTLVLIPNTIVLLYYTVSFASDYQNALPVSVDPLRRVKDTDQSWGFSFVPLSNQDSITSASRLAILGAIDIALSLLPVTRTSLWLFLFGIPFERAIRYHRILARFGIFVFLIHIIYYSIYWTRRQDFWQQSIDGEAMKLGPNFSGWLSFICLVCLFLTSLESIRRSRFEIFYRFHWLFFLGFFTFTIFHPGASTFYFLAPFILWIIDIFMRIYSLFRHHIKIISIELLPVNVIRIEWAKPNNFTYDAGQYVFVNIPHLSIFEYHPFSLSTSPHHSTVQIHIRVLGNWTSHLENLIKQQKENIINLPMYIEGAYGSLSLDLSRYNNIILISGGIGITPLQSIFNSLFFEYVQKKRRVTNCHFVWSVRETALLHSLYGGGRKKANRNETENKNENKNESSDGTSEVSLDVDQEQGISDSGLLPPFFAPDLLDFHSKVESNDSRFEDRQVESPFRTSFYLTATKTISMSILQEKYGRCCIPGRPNLRALLNDMRNRTSSVGEHEIAVLTCGPLAMVDEIRKLAVDMSDVKSQFHVHRECFEL